MSEKSLPNANSLSIQTQLPVFWFSLHDYRDELMLARLAIEEVRQTHPDSTPSNVKAVYMSPWKSHLLNPKFGPLCSLVTQIGLQVSEEHLKANLQALNLDLRVTDCWGVIYEHSDHTIPHHHYPSDLSAVVYLEADENCAPIVFGDGVAVTPRPNLLVMFPGILLHEVPENHAKRTVIAMNLQKFPNFS